MFVAIAGACALIWTYGYAPSNLLNRDGLDGKAALEKKSYEKAFRLLDQACTAQDLEACSNLGLMYEDGLATKRDISRANALYERACVGGNAFGCTLLGISFDKGNGVNEDRRRADGLYTKACNAGNGAGCVNLGNNQYKVGKYAEAAQLFERGCNSKTARGCNNLAAMLSSGDGGTVDQRSAHQLFKKACRLGSGEGCTNAGLSFWNGAGVKQNFEKAGTFFEKACKAKRDPNCENLNRDKTLEETVSSRAIDVERKKSLFEGLIASFIGLVLGVGSGKLLDFNVTIKHLASEVIQKMAGSSKFSFLELQNTIRPRWLIWSAVIILTCALGVVIYCALKLAAYPAAFCILVFLISVWVSRRFVPPKVGDQIYIEWIYSNVQNQYANYVRDKDTVRAKRLQEVLPIVHSLRDDGLD
jgi:TPR repeat protein